MTLLALDGRFAGQVLAYVPKGYHCVMHLDNHHDIISCHPEYMRDQFVDGMMDGLEAFTDPHTALRVVNAMRHGTMLILATQVLRFMVDTNLSIYLAQCEARQK